MNLKTEEQAKEKWCCQPTLTREEPKCCASECMAWRWIVEPDLDDEVRQELVSNKPVGVVPTKMENGYCGLAGRSN